jgi:hypothetical protein
MVRRFTITLIAAGIIALAAAQLASAQATPSIRVTIWQARILPGETYPYPNTPVGEYRVPDTVVVRNTGTADLTFTGTTPVTVTSAPSGSFSVDLLPVGSIPPGQSASFIVRFSPTETGPNVATITIDTNDPATPTFTFHMKSYGVSRKIRSLMLFGG